MSAFETATWNWYWETVSGFTMEAGIVAELFKDLGLTGWARRLFLRAVKEIHKTVALIRMDREAKVRNKE